MSSLGDECSYYSDYDSDFVTSEKHPLKVGVTNGLREHAEHCDFFASTSRNKKFALRACEQRKNLGSTSKRALV